jgi:hypothetical protein
VDYKAQSKETWGDRGRDGIKNEAGTGLNLCTEEDEAVISIYVKNTVGRNYKFQIQQKMSQRRCA